MYVYRYDASWWCHHCYGNILRVLRLYETGYSHGSEVEAAIQESLDKMMEGKTVIAIAHRLSTIAAMDRLIVLEPT